MQVFFLGPFGKIITQGAGHVRDGPFLGHTGRIMHQNVIGITGNDAQIGHVAAFLGRLGKIFVPAQPLVRFAAALRTGQLGIGNVPPVQATHDGTNSVKFGIRQGWNKIIFATPTIDIAARGKKQKVVRINVKMSLQILYTPLHFLRTARRQIEIRPPPEGHATIASGRPIQYRTRCERTRASTTAWPSSSRVSTDTWQRIAATRLPTIGFFCDTE